jgi:hypothetical protein
MKSGFSLAEQILLSIIFLERWFLYEFMTRLSVNLNKIALVRNARSLGIPSVTKAARTCIAAGAYGITVHPRPDERI